MKRKIISLLMCVACLLAVLASCGDVECDAHVDADKNSLCDNCSIPVITIIEKVPTEETVVETVVSAIPEGATYGSVWAVEAPEYAVIPVLSDTAKIDGEVYGYYNGFVAIRYSEQTAGADTEEDYSDDKYTLTYRLYNPVTAANVIAPITYEYEAANGIHVNSAEFSVVSEDGVAVLLKVTTTEWEKENNGYESWTNETRDVYYTFAGTKVADSKTLDEEAMANKNDDTPIYLPFNFEVEKVVGEYAYVIYNDTKIAIDYEAGAILASGDAASFIERPAFDAVIGTTGYINRNGNVYLYDLNEWIKCVYAYEIPSNSSVFYLANGNLLIQTTSPAHVETKNYDTLNAEGAKVDIDYFVFDVAAKTATEVEFGYMITSVAIADEAYNDAVKNVITANVITNKTIGKSITLCTDDNLGIIANQDAVVPEFGLVENLKAVANGVLLGTLNYGEGSSVRVLYKADGTEIAKLPNNAVVKDTYIIISGKYYDFNMNLKFDPKADAENEFTVYSAPAGAAYVLFKNGDDIYYWNVTMTAPTLLVDVASEEDAEVEFTASIASITADYIVVKKVVVGETENVTTYTVYNASGAAVYTAEENVVSINEKTIGEDTYWVIELPDDVYYIVK